MPSNSHSVHCPLRVQLTNNVAQQITKRKITSRDHGDDDDDWDDDDNAWEVRSDARSELRKAYADGERWIANDTAESDGRDKKYALTLLPKETTGETNGLILFVVQRPDCVLAVSVKHIAGHVPRSANSVHLTGDIVFGDDYARGETPGGMNGQLLAELDRRKSLADRHNSAVDLCIRDWVAWLDISEKLEEKTLTTVKYFNCARGKDPKTLIFKVERVPGSWRSGNVDLELLGKSGDARRKQRRHLSGRVVYIDGNRIKIESRRDFPDVVPSSGDCSPAKSEDLKRQRRAIERLKAGEAELTNLHEILYGGSKLSLSSYRNNNSVPIGDCLDGTRLNDDQRLAVSRALDTPDCFFLQGPPGTGKTTFIAELCYQAARRGKKILVASQTNLAVDNALCRLQNSVDILPIRFTSDIQRVDPMAHQFVGDAAVERWGRSLASRPAPNHSRLKEQGEAFDLLLELLPYAALLDAPTSAAANDGTSNVSVATLIQQIKHIEKTRAEVAEFAASAKEILELRAEADKRRLALSPLEPHEGHSNLALSTKTGLSSVDRALDVFRRIDELVRELLNGDAYRFPFDFERIDEWSDVWRTGDRASVGKIEGELRSIERIEREPTLFNWVSRAYHKWIGGSYLVKLQGTLAVFSSAWIDSTGIGASLKAEILRETSERRDAYMRTKSRVHGLELSRAQRARKIAVGLWEKFPHLKRFFSDDATFDETQLHRVLAEATSVVASKLKSLVGSLERTVSDDPIPSNWKSAATFTAFISGLRSRPGCASLGYWKTSIRLQREWHEFLTGAGGFRDSTLEEIFHACANVVGATCSVAGSQAFLKHHSRFDLVIVDEVSKATPIELLVPSILGARVVYVGDHKQLPPYFGADSESDDFVTVSNELGVDHKALEATLQRDLFRERFEQLSSESKGSRAMMLPRQYRMHSQIMECVNDFYDGALRIGLADQDSRKQHGIKGVPWIPENSHVLWIDMPDSSEWRHRVKAPGKSLENSLAATLVARIVETIAEKLGSAQTYGDGRPDIGVISLYKAQSKTISDGLAASARLAATGYTELRCDTVDSFQGMERDVIILDLCVNGGKPSEFVCSPRRMNVALSRARRLLVVVGSSKTFVGSSVGGGHYGRVLTVAKRGGGYLHAADIVG